MANGVVKFVDRDGHTSRGGESGGILDRITGWWREDTAYLLSAPAET